MAAALPSFTGTLAVRVALHDFLNLELIRTGHYRLHVSVFSAAGQAAAPVSCAAAPPTLEAVSRGAGCGESPLPPLAAELDDAQACCLSRSLHIRYTDEVHSVREAYTFHLEGAPLRPPDARLYVRLRLLRAEGAEAAAAEAAGAAIPAAAFAPAASRTLCLSTLEAAAGLCFYAPVLFDRDSLAAVGVTVHAGVLAAALAPLPLPRALAAAELAASVEELLPPPRPVPGSSAAHFARPEPLPQQQQAAAVQALLQRPPFWARRFLAHAAQRHTLREWVSPAHHRRAALARGEAVRALVTATVAMALGSGGGGSSSASSGVSAGAAEAQAAAAMHYFSEGVKAAAAASAAAAAGEACAPATAAAAAALDCAAPGAAEEECAPEALAAARQALVLSLARVEQALLEWRGALAGAGGAQASPAAAAAAAAPALQLAELAESQAGSQRAPPFASGGAPSPGLADVALDASGVFARPQRGGGSGGDSGSGSAAHQVAALLQASAAASAALARGWREAFSAMMQAPAGALEALQGSFRAAALAALAPCCLRVPPPPPPPPQAAAGAPAAAAAALAAPLQEALRRPQHCRAVAEAAAAAAWPPPPPPQRTHDPAHDSARFYITSQWVRYGSGGGGCEEGAGEGGSSGGGGGGAALPHLVVCVHGLGGSSFDLRGFKAALKLHHPALHCHAAASCAGESAGDIVASGLRLGEEVAALCREADARAQPYARLSFLCFSLGGLWARVAVRSPALAPYTPRLHALVTIASPHLGFPSDAKGSSLLSAGSFLMSSWVGKKKALALAQLALAAEGSGSSSASSAAAAAAASAASEQPLPLLYYLACGWPSAAAAGAAGAAGSASSEPLASLRASGLAPGPNGAAVLAHFKHVALLASPQDTYSPLHSALACPAAGAGGGGGASGASSLHGAMVAGFWEGCSSGGAVQRVSVHLADVAGGGGGGAAGEAAVAEGCAGPRDEACAPPPASLAAQVGSGVMSLFDSVSGRDAHMGLLVGEALPLALALGLREAWE